MKRQKDTASTQVGRLASPDQSYIYVIGMADGPQKIGVARDPENRMASLQIGNAGLLILSVKLPVPTGEALLIEACTHHHLRDDWLRGEWFNVSPGEAATAIDRAVDEVRSGRWSAYRSVRPRGFNDKPIEGQSAFRAWRRRLNITQASAAMRLGLSKRQVEYFDTGAKPLPAQTSLAMRCLEEHPELCDVEQLNA